MRLATWRDQLGWLRWPLLALTLLIPVWFFQFSSRGSLFRGEHLRYLVLAGIAAFAATWLGQGTQRIFRPAGFLVGLTLAVAAFTFGQAFSSVTDYPFSLYWSEGNRFWDYSVLFGRRLYEYPPEEPIYAFIDRGRQALWGLPFLFADISIRQMRIWNGIVNSLPYIAFGLFAFRRSNHYKHLWLIMGLWTYLFLYQGPIYTPLVLCAILVAVAWRRSLWIAFPLIAIAGYYAQLTRYTWMFAPAMWVGMLVLVDLPASSISTNKQNSNLRDWRWKQAGIGIFAGLFGGYIYRRLPRIGQELSNILVSQPVDGTGNIFRRDIVSIDGITNTVNQQPLLWERLLPNATYEFGIVLALLLAIVPLISLLIYLVHRREWKLDWLRGSLLVCTLLIFLIVGLVISVKIGGGADLHNLDMFLIGMVFAASLAWKSGGEQMLVKLEQQPAWVRWMMVSMIAIFAYKPVDSARPLMLPAPSLVKQALITIQQEVNLAKSQGEILFLDQRQLLTFDFIDSPLVDEYEKKLLMDKALAGDKTYFSGYYADLQSQRFKLIISEPLRLQYRESDYQFGDENNSWVKWVSKPTLCYYEPYLTFRELRLQLLKPRLDISECPDYLK
jgi:hypothetical protein